MKRLTSILICIAMLAAMFSVTASAATGTISVTVPDDLTAISYANVFEDCFNGDNNFANSKSAEYKDAVTETNGVLDIDTSKLASVPNGIKNCFWSRKLVLPSPRKGYRVSFDFCRMTDDQTTDSDYLQWQHFKEDTAAEKVAYRIKPVQFDKGKQYHVEYEIVLSAKGTWTMAGTKTDKSSGTVTTLAVIPITSPHSQRKEQIGFYIYNSAAAGKKTIHYQMDNFLIEEHLRPLVKTSLTGGTASGSVKTIIATYDQNNVLLDKVESAGGTIAADGKATADFDVAEKAEVFQNAKYVKVMYWDGLENAKPYAAYQEIGDSISTAVSGGIANPQALEITSDMKPAGATGNFTVFAYTVPFTVKSDNIPTYDPQKHKLLVLNQYGSALSQVNYDPALYDKKSQDIVVIVNADGASQPKTTLVENVIPPEITNVVMQLGADQSERRFTWFSLEKAQGQLTIQKTTDMTDGNFTSNATVINATRDEVSGREYSFKDYYYNNKAAISGLEPDTEYCYQLSNGTSKTDKIKFTTVDDGTSFSFAFGGDAQVGGSEYQTYEEETKSWGRTVRQMRTAPEFDGTEFFLSAGDQVDSNDRHEGTETDIEWDVLDEQQYDIYANHSEFLQFPQAVVLGNHDPKSKGKFYQHFNMPNLSETYGVYTYSSSIYNQKLPVSSNYYFKYKSAMFIYLNLNNFKGSPSTKIYDSGIEAQNKAVAEQYGEYLRQVCAIADADPDILWKIVVVHQSAYGSSYHGEMRYTMTADGKMKLLRTEQQALIDARKYLMPELYNVGIDMVLSGHDHVYTRTHIIKPATDADGNFTYEDDAIVTPYANGSYTFADGTNVPKFNTTWADRNGVVYSNLQVKSKPVKVTNPDGILHITGATSSGSQVNSVENTSRFTAVNSAANTRALSRIDITPSTLTLRTYNLGTNTDDNITLIDSFVIERTNEVEVKAIAFEESETTIAKGKNKTLGIRFYPAEPNNTNVAWSSDNTGVATVENGVVTAMATGVANITATSANGKTATCRVTVVDGVAVSSVTLPSTLSIEAKTTKTLVAVVSPSNATDKGLEWSSNAPQIADVDKSGNVTALKNGTAVITARATDGSGKSASCTVTVTYTPSTSAFNHSSLTLRICDKTKLELSITPSTATFKDYTWSTTDATVATVDQEGNITAKNLGTATIIATSPERELRCQVTVVGGDLFVQDYEGGNTTLDGSSAQTSVGYTTEDKTWQIVDEGGNKVIDMDLSRYTGTKIYSTYKSILITDADQTKRWNRVTVPASGHTLAFDVKRMENEGLKGINFRIWDENGKGYQDRVDISKFDLNEWYNVKIVRYPNGSGSGWYKKASDERWTENASVVMPYGYLGTSQTYFNYMDIMPQFVKNASETSDADQLKTHFRMDNLRIYSQVDPSDFDLLSNSITAKIGEIKPLKASFTPSNATERYMVYTSSKPSVATVDCFGNIKAVAQGATVITAYSVATGESKTCTVTVGGVGLEFSKAANGENWDFTVKTEAPVNGENVYVGVFDAANRLISVGVQEYSSEGNVISILKNANAEYFKAFVWGSNLIPCAEAKRIEK